MLRMLRTRRHSTPFFDFFSHRVQVRSAANYYYVILSFNDRLLPIQ